MERECTGCHQVKPLDRFGVQKNGKYGRRARCFDCMAAADQRRRNARRGGPPVVVPRQRSADGTSRCTKCKVVRPIQEFRADPRARDGVRSNCKQCDSQQAVAYNARARAAGTLWNARYPEASAMIRRRSHLKRYGITPEDYDALLADQGGGCAICGARTPRSSRRRYFTVDHDHQTGAVRGLLCAPCNTGIGALGDDPGRIAAALTYVLAAARGAARPARAVDPTTRR